MKVPCGVLRVAGQQHLIVESLAQAGIGLKWELLCNACTDCPLLKMHAGPRWNHVRNCDGSSGEDQSCRTSRSLCNWQAHSRWVWIWLNSFGLPCLESYNIQGKMILQVAKHAIKTLLHKRVQAWLAQVKCLIQTISLHMKYSNSYL